MVATKYSLKHSIEKVEELSMSVIVSLGEGGEFETEFGLNVLKSFLFRILFSRFPHLRMRISLWSIGGEVD